MKATINRVIPNRMPASSRLSQPLHYSDALLFRINRLRAVGGGLVLRYCEGQFGVTRREWVMIALLAVVAGCSVEQLPVASSTDKALRDDAQLLVNLGLVHDDNEVQTYWDDWIAWMRAQGWRRFGWYVWDQGPGLPGDWRGRLAPRQACAMRPLSPSRARVHHSR